MFMTAVVAMESDILHCMVQTQIIYIKLSIMLQFSLYFNPLNNAKMTLYERSQIISMLLAAGETASVVCWTEMRVLHGFKKCNIAIFKNK